MMDHDLFICIVRLDPQCLNRFADTVEVSEALDEALRETLGRLDSLRLFQTCKSKQLANFFGGVSIDRCFV